MRDSEICEITTLKQRRNEMVSRVTSGLFIDIEVELLRFKRPHGR